MLGTEKYKETEEVEATSLNYFNTLALEKRKAEIGWLGEKEDAELAGGCCCCRLGLGQCEQVLVR